MHPKRPEYNAPRSGWPGLALLLALAGASAGPLKVGDKAPSFTLMTLEGKPFNLKDEIGDLPLLLTFFTAHGLSGWVENKDFRAAVDVDSTFPGFVRAIGIAVGNKKEDFNQLRYPGTIDVPLLLAPGLDDPAVKAFKITQTPASFLIGEDGTLLAVNLSAKEIVPKVADLLETRWQDKAYRFADYGPPPNIPLSGAARKNVNTTPGKPALYLFWAALSIPSETSLKALDSVVKLNDDFEYWAATSGPEKLASQRLSKIGLKNLAPARYASSDNDTLFGRTSPLLPQWIIVNTKGHVIFRGAGPLKAEEIRDLIARARAYMRGS